MTTTAAPQAIPEKKEEQLIFSARDKLFEAISHTNCEDKFLLERAFEFAKKAHYRQYRQSGEPYIIHPIEVAIELAVWGEDIISLTAALLHDVVEDTGTSIEEIREEFGTEVAAVVDGVSKFKKIAGKDFLELQAESFRKMLLAGTKDLRVLLVKLADRLHNMRTLGSMRRDKKRRIAQETLDIYAELANRIGMNAVYYELQNLAFKHLYPYRYQVISRALKHWRGQKEQLIERVMRDFAAQLVAFNVEATIKGGEKHLYGVFQKMRYQRLHFSQVMDMYCFVVLVHNVLDCYRALGALHHLYNPKPGSFRDFIAIPKQNGSQSLKTTLISSLGLSIEVQIRTYEMDELFEISRFSSVTKARKKRSEVQPFKRSAQQWMEVVKSVQEDSNSAVDFYEDIKKDLYASELYVFTPKGKIIVLPTGATVIDFAYAVHTEVGHQSVGAAVNGVSVFLYYRLHSGDIVHIKTRDDASPDETWLEHAVSAKATSAIRSRLRQQKRNKTICVGEKLLQGVLVEVLPEDLIFSEEVKDAYIRNLSDRHLTFQDVLYGVGKGELEPHDIALEIAKVAYNESLIDI